MKTSTRIAAFLIALAFGPAAHAVAFSGLYVFGDSLSDTDVRATNGPMWVEYLAPQLGLGYDPADNYAVAGSTTGNTVAQVAGYVGSEVPDADALYVVWNGANDLFAAYSTLDPANPDLVALQLAVDSAITTGTANLLNSVASLSAAGAEHIMVPNLPNLGRLPEIQATDAALPQLDVSAFVEGSTQAFNQTLAAGLAGSSAVEVDIFTLLTAVTDDPAAYGFSNDTDGCVAAGALPGCDGYVFFDGVHPTSASHALIADEMLAALRVPVPGSGWLLVAGLAGLVAHRRRRFCAAAV